MEPESGTPGQRRAQHRLLRDGAGTDPDRAVADVLALIEPEWQVPAMRRAARPPRVMQYVRYDPRGVGMSDAYAGSFTIDVYRRTSRPIADAVSPTIPSISGDPGGWGCWRWRLRRSIPIESRSSCSGPPTVGAEFMSDPMRQLFELEARLGPRDGEHGASDHELRRARGRRAFATMSRTATASARDRSCDFEEDFLEWDVTDLLPASPVPHARDAPEAQSLLLWSTTRRRMDDRHTRAHECS